MFGFKNKRIYLDYAAAAPQLSIARAAFLKGQSLIGNASSIHKDGIAVKKALEEARIVVAKSISAHADEIVFTATGTESDNLAILGVFKEAVLGAKIKKPHIITTAIEHPAVLEACRHIESVGGEVTYVMPDEQGLINPKDVRAALKPETILVTVIYANNEIGTIAPIREIAKVIRQYKKETDSAYPLFHSDACQAAQYVNMNVEQLGVDLLTFSGVKMGAGFGAAALYVKRKTPIASNGYGGGQEGGLRSGTPNVAAASAFAAACLEVMTNTEKETERLTALRDYFFDEVSKRWAGVRINGSRAERLPNNMHISFSNITSELLVLELDAKGISASAGSACSATEQSESEVLAALYGKGDGKKWGSVRFSMGPQTTKKDLDTVLFTLEKIFKKYESVKSFRN